MLRLASRAVRPRCAAFATAAAAPSAPASPAAAAAAAAALQQGLALYRRILRAHRLKLPFHLRELGDRYVRDEFRKHRGADAKWLRGFVAGWEEYAQMLERQSAADVAGGFGGGGGGGGGGMRGAATPQQLQLLPTDAQILLHYVVTLLDDAVAQRLRGTSARMHERVLFGRALPKRANANAGDKAVACAPTVSDRIFSTTFVDFEGGGGGFGGGYSGGGALAGPGDGDFFALGSAARGDAPSQHASLRFRLRCATEGPPRTELALVADGRAVAAEGAGADARGALARTLALWARLQCLTAQGELAIHRSQTVELGEELASLFVAV